MGFDEPQRGYSRFRLQGFVLDHAVTSGRSSGIPAHGAAPCFSTHEILHIQIGNDQWEREFWFVDSRERCALMIQFVEMRWIFEFSQLL
jgi:hypothetical protein